MAKIVELSPNISGGRRHTLSVPVEERKTPLEPPRKLTASQRKIWERYIDPAGWIADGDSMLAYAYVVLSAKLLKDPDEVTAAELSQLRLIAGDLGLRPAERQRLSKPKEKADPTAEFFGKRG